MTMPPPTLEYASPNDFRVSRLARFLSGLAVIPIAMSLIVSVIFSLPSLSTGGPSSRPLPPYTPGLTFPPVTCSLVGLALSIVALWRIRKSPGRLMGVGLARRAIVLWFLMLAAFMSLYFFMQYERREQIFEYDIRGSCHGINWVASLPGQSYPPSYGVPGCDYLVSGVSLPMGSPRPANLVVLIQTTPYLDGSRWVGFANDDVRLVSKSDLPAVWSANNAARTSLGLAPLPPP